jgi:hypothetical protein
VAIAENPCKVIRYRYSVGEFPAPSGSVMRTVKSLLLLVLLAVLAPHVCVRAGRIWRCRR